MAKIYLASSWRNPDQPRLVRLLRAEGHEVYDFRNPPHGRGGFASWSDIDPDWLAWSAEAYRDALNSRTARLGFGADFDGMKWADVGVLLLPSGRSAHLEAGFMAGAGKPVVLYTHDGQEPELMALLLASIVINDAELIARLREHDCALAVQP